MLKIVTNNLKTELLDGFIRSSKLPGEEEATRTDREESEKKLPLTTSVYIVALISFVGDMARGALFPVLWKLCEKLGGTAIDLGYLIACFSAGRMAFGPPLGYLSDAKTHRLSLMIATVVLSAGAFFWANTSVMGNIYFLYLAQFLLGCGSGSLGVTRAFVAEQCPAKRKTEVMAYMNALQYAGFTVCPLWGSTASFFGAMINDYWFYALPAYSVFLVSLAACLLLMFKFQDIPKQFTSSAGQVSLPKEALGIQLIDIEAASNATVKDANSKNANKDLGSIIESVNSPMATTRSENIRERGGSTGIMIVKEDGNSPKSDDELLFRKKSDYLESTTIVILALMLVNIVARGAIAIYETTVAALAHDNYGISIFEIGLIVSVVGSVGTLQLVFFKKLYSRFTDMQLMMGSLGVMSIAQLFMWDFEQDTVSPWIPPILERHFSIHVDIPYTLRFLAERARRHTATGELHLCNNPHVRLGISCCADSGMYTAMHVR